jgi:hypothetical protein
MGYVAHAQPVLIPGERSHVFDMATVKQLYDETRRFFENRCTHVGLTDRGLSDSDTGAYYQDKRTAALGPSGNLIDFLPVSYNKNKDTWLTRPYDTTKLRVAVLPLTPGIDCPPTNRRALHDFLCDCDGIIVEAYGAGNGQKEIKRLLKKLREVDKIPVAIITECNHSGVSSDYGVALDKTCGALCHDMTLGCAYTRMYLSVHMLSLIDDYDGPTASRRDRVEQIMQAPMMMCFTPADNAFLRDRLVAVGV